MVASRNRPKGFRNGPFGLGVLALSLVPTQIGYQDLASLLARQPAVAQRARAHVLASPFGTIHAATFSFPRPVGTGMPESPVYQLASLGVRELDLTGSISPDFSGGPEVDSRVSPDFPIVNRRLKGDLLVTRQRPEPPPPGGTRERVPGRVKTVTFPRPEGEQRPVPPAPASEPETPAQSSGTEPATAPATYSLASLPPASATPAPSDNSATEGSTSAERMARLYFGNNPVGDSIGPMQPWPAERQALIVPGAGDPDIKRSALAPADIKSRATQDAGQMIAPKGEVTGPDQRPRTPAERLKLDSKARAKAEKCLAEAVYFESRGETKRGQIAVAQVVMNRVFSGFYPGDVCGVVYQNAHRHLACQFTFACDGIKDVVTEPDMWAQAKEIARDTLDGKLWLTDIGKSTHYHADWVHPWWVRTMRKLSTVGVHKFYRPHRWGDGSDAPSWGPGITPQNAKL